MDRSIGWSKCAGSGASKQRSAADVRFAPIATDLMRRGNPPLCAMSRREQMQQCEAKITDHFVGAGEEHVGMSMSSVVAVCRLLTNSNLGHGARGKGATDRGLDGVGSEPSVGQPGSLQRARPAVEVALAPERQQLRQVRKA